MALQASSFLAKCKAIIVKDIYLYFILYFKAKAVSIYKMMKHLCARYRMRPYSRAYCLILQFPALNTKSHCPPPPIFCTASLTLMITVQRWSSWSLALCQPSDSVLRSRSPTDLHQAAPFITSHNTVHNWKESIKLYLSMNSFSPWF